MKKKIFFITFIILFLIQFSVPLFMIMRQYHIVSVGTLYKIKCEPVDPMDLFRGRYVTLRFSDESTILVYDESVTKVREIISEADGYRYLSYDKNNALYVSISKNADGFLRLDSCSETVPENGDYLYLMPTSCHTDAKILRFDMPFDRVFMNEKYAPEAERILRRNSSGKETAYVEVYIKNGKYSKINLFVDGKRIHDYIDEKLEEEKKRLELE